MYHILHPCTPFGPERNHSRHLVAIVTIHSPQIQPSDLVVPLCLLAIRRPKQLRHQWLALPRLLVLIVAVAPSIQ